jgi:integrase
MKVPTMSSLDKTHAKKFGDYSRKQHRTAMDRFLTYVQKNWHTPVSEVFFNGTFTTDLDMFIASKPTKAYQDRTSGILRSWEADAKRLTCFALPPDFGDALQQLIQQSGTTVWGLTRMICERTGERHESVAFRLYRWVRNVHVPDPRKIPMVEQIEDLLKVGRNTLVSRIPVFVTGVKTRMNARSCYSPYAKRLARTLRKSYAINVSKVPALKMEWEDFYRFKTTKILPEGERRKPWGRWTVRPDHKCHTGDHNAKLISSFLGFLHLEKSEDKTNSGLAVPMARLSMALVSVPSFVIGYINDFVVERADGIYHHQVIIILRFCRQLTCEGTGYLRQHPELFAHKVVFTEDWQQWIKTFPGRRGRKNPPARTWWAAWCEHNYLQFDAILRDLQHTKSIRKSRDPEYNIQAILKLDHPMDVLFAFIEAMGKRRKGGEKSASGRARAVKFRDLLLIKLLSVNPLRVRNIVEMTWRPDNTGHLQKVNGVWYIRIRRDEFKNWFSRPADKDYTVPLPPDCNEYIEQYLAFRQYLKDADRCDLLFLPVSNGRNNQLTGLGYSQRNLSYLVLKLTRVYVPDELAPGGFGPHAFRHIVAHSYLKGNPKAYGVVADVLNDRLETVIQEYGHVGVDDNFRHWLSFYAEEQERVGGPGSL